MNTIEKSIIEQINLLHGELESIVKTGLQKAIQIGGLLSECKTKLPHGEFASWMESNCRFSVRTGQNYMKLHDNRDKLTDAHSLTQAYKLLKNETVSHLTWDGVFEILQSHIDDVKAGQPDTYEYDIDQIMGFIRGQMLQIDSYTMPELISLDKNLERAQQMLGETRIRMAQKMGEILNDIDAMSPANRIKAQWLMQLHSIHPGIRITPTSLELPDDLPHEAWEKVGDLLGSCPFMSVA